MKQAILITAYKDIDKLEILINQFDNDFSFYIHIDKKSQIPTNHIESLNKIATVKVVSRKYSINWAGFNHTKAILHLTEEALKNKNIEYIHLISGQDYPIKSSNQIKDFLRSNRGSEFIENFKLPYEKWADHGGLDRINYYRFYDYLNAQSKNQKRILNIIVKIQKIFNFKRSRKNLPKNIYGGWAWFTLTRECMQYITDYTKENPKYFKRYEYTSAACEIYFHTIIMNSTFSKNVVNNDLRYIKWEGNKPNPEILNKKHYHNMIKSDALFTRKIDYTISEKLLKKLDIYRKDN